TLSLDRAYPESDLSPLPAKHLHRLQTHDFSQLSTNNHQPTIALDGLLGIGTTGSPREPVSSAIKRLNLLRRDQHTFVFSADVPSGLDADTGQPGKPCVIADCTITIGHGKVGLVADAATDHVGRLALAELEDLRPASFTNHGCLITNHAKRLLPARDFDSHKGKWGRVGVIAGSRGLLGAARLCSAAAVRSGGGLVTLYVKPDAYELFATSCIPEVMVKPIDDYTAALDDHLDSLAIGPGLGSDHDDEILTILRETTIPTLADADALNALARNPSQLSSLASQLVLTPHPGEFARLAPDLADRPRAEAAQRFADRHPLTLLLKGARTVIAEREQPLLYNSTGNPGMGSGGMGDVLSGVGAALLAQGCSPRDAASLAAWLGGRAAECFVFSSAGSPETLTASHVIDHLGPSFEALRSPISF
ncbi:MAG: NAD(P)H-hydrate dehydratase, partial [Chthoniobacterales bacterium]